MVAVIYIMHATENCAATFDGIDLFFIEVNAKLFMC